MDLRKELLKGHNRNQAQKIADYACNSPAKFKSLIDIYLEGPYRITQRASWPIGMCVEKYPVMVKPHLKQLLDFLKHPGTHDAVRRNTMRLLQYVDIPKRNHEQVINICFAYLQQKNIAVAIQAFAMSVLAKIIHDKPELQRELKIILEDQFPFASPAFRSRALKVLKSFRTSP
jgi:hypothetical protein